MSSKPHALLSDQRAQRRSRSLAPLDVEPVSPETDQGTPVAPADATAATVPPAKTTTADATEPVKQVRQPKAPAGRGRVSARMPEECFAMLRDAWWSDLDYGGDHTASSQGAWLGRALLDYTSLDLAERQRVRDGLPDWSQSEAQARSWMVTKEAHAAIGDTVANDRKLHQRATTSSSLIIEAIAYGYAGATARRGSTIPSAPDNLPTRTLVR